MGLVSHNIETVNLLATARTAVALDQAVKIFILEIPLATGVSEEATRSMTAGRSSARLVLAKHVSTSAARPIWSIVSLFHLINTHPLPKSLRILPTRLWEISTPRTLLRHSTQIPFLLLRGMDNPRQILPI